MEIIKTVLIEQNKEPGICEIENSIEAFKEIIDGELSITKVNSKFAMIGRKESEKKEKGTTQFNVSFNDAKIVLGVGESDNTFVGLSQSEAEQFILLLERRNRIENCSV